MCSISNYFKLYLQNSSNLKLLYRQWIWGWHFRTFHCLSKDLHLSVSHAHGYLTCSHASLPTKSEQFYWCSVCCKHRLYQFPLGVIHTNMCSHDTVRCFGYMCVCLLSVCVWRWCTSVHQREALSAHFPELHLPAVPPWLSPCPFFAY